MRQPGGNEQIWAAVVFEGRLDEAALRSACVQRLNSRAPVRILQMQSLPRNAMGKVVRHELAAQAARQAADPFGNDLRIELG